jgi:hypothetical protein
MSPSSFSREAATNDRAQDIDEEVSPGSRDSVPDAYQPGAGVLVVGLLQCLLYLRDNGVSERLWCRPETRDPPRGGSYGGNNACSTPATERAGPHDHQVLILECDQCGLYVPVGHSEFISEMMRHDGVAVPVQPRRDRE